MLSLEREQEDTEGAESTGDNQTNRPAAAAAISAAAETMCGICAEECCDEDDADGVVTGLRSVRADCGHLFCHGCLEDLLATAVDASGRSNFCMCFSVQGLDPTDPGVCSGVTACLDCRWGQVVVPKLSCPYATCTFSRHEPAYYSRRRLGRVKPGS
jgi:hypothetical protein